MKKLLIVNACVQRDLSRTNRLCRALTNQINQTGAYCVEELILEDESLAALDSQALVVRNELLAKNERQHSIFRYARQLQAADEIIVAAPYWDLSFPAALKCYIEAVSVVGVTFCYQADGTPKGLCRACRLTYVTTSGGFVGACDFGYDYIKAIAQLFGIAHIQRVCAEGLDIVGADVEGILRRTEKQITGQ